MKKREYKSLSYTRFLALGVSAFLLAAVTMGLGGCTENGEGAVGECTENGGGAGTEALEPDPEQFSESYPSSEIATAQGYQVVETQTTGQNLNENVPESASQDIDQTALAPLEVHFLDVGQGDSTLVVCGEDAMLIDAGDNSQGTKIQNYLQKQEVEALKYVICTHPDEDHIGGMDVILYKFECETILMTDEEKDTNTYRDVVDTMENRGYQRTLPVTGQQYVLGDATFTIVGPVSMSSESNNNSIAIVLEHGNRKFLFTGDAEEDEEAEILGEAEASGISLEADVYKAGHHGSRNSSSEALLDAVSPAYAVISCGEGNSYGHPNAETLNNFRSRGISVFRTDEQGSVIVICDEEQMAWNCSPSDTWQTGEPSIEISTQTEEEVEAEVNPEVPQTVDYICNTNTKKFHYPDCSSVKQMSEKNKWPVNATREELIQQGYVPCKKCNP